MVASQLVNAVPHMDGKFYAATQTMDEARHVEVFARYIEKLDHVYPIAPSLKELLDKTLSVDGWMFKAVGMQIVVEGLALYTFRDMRETTEEPLLKQLLTYVARDEARHTAFGIQYLSSVVPQLAPERVAELEDFAFEATRMLLDSRRGATLNDAMMTILIEAGLDPKDVAAGLSRDQDKLAKAVARRGGRLGPVSGFVVPTLRRIGLFSDRVQRPLPRDVRRDAHHAAADRRRQAGDQPARPPGRGARGPRGVGDRPDAHLTPRRARPGRLRARRPSPAGSRSDRNRTRP